MAKSVNKVILLGNVGKDPEIRNTQAGSKICNLTIATSETWNDRTSGERKERIFEIYLNSVEWGNGIYGAQAAAQHYYRTNANNLSVGQAARLAVMLPRPRYYDENRNSAYLVQRSGVIAGRMGGAELPKVK